MSEVRVDITTEVGPHCLLEAVRRMALKAQDRPGAFSTWYVEQLRMAARDIENALNDAAIEQHPAMRGGEPAPPRPERGEIGDDWLPPGCTLTTEDVARGFWNESDPTLIRRGLDNRDDRWRAAVQAAVAERDAERARAQEAEKWRDTWRDSHRAERERADGLERERELYKDDFESASRRLNEALGELRCPDCGCGDQIDAESKECGCDSPICAREAGQTLAQWALTWKGRAERAEAERDALKARLAAGPNAAGPAKPPLRCCACGQSWSEGHRC